MQHFPPWSTKSKLGAAVSSFQVNWWIRVGQNPHFMGNFILLVRLHPNWNKMVMVKFDSGKYFQGEEKTSHTDFC